MIQKNPTPKNMQGLLSYPVANKVAGNKTNKRVHKKMKNELHFPFIIFGNASTGEHTSNPLKNKTAETDWVK